MWDHLKDLIGLAPLIILWAWCGGTVARRAGFPRWWGLFMQFPPD